MIVRGMFTPLLASGLAKKFELGFKVSEELLENDAYSQMTGMSDFKLGEVYPSMYPGKMWFEGEPRRDLRATPDASDSWPPKDWPPEIEEWWNR